MKRFGSTGAWGLAATALALMSQGCGSGGGSTVTGDVPIVYAKRSTSISINPTNGAPFAAGGDLMLRELSSASAAEHNLTAAFTQGAGDASDPEVSYDGKKVVFSMRCPTSNTATVGGQPACTGRWNIWEYDMTGTGLTDGVFRRITSSTDSDDVDPYYLPAGGGFVFSSNRQTQSKANQGVPGQSYFALDEYERERVFNLHTMDASGNNITQISFNQSHDRNPVVLRDGTIMFARWEHLADRNRFAIFKVKPDGTDMFVRYGAQSPGNSFLHPREMDPNGPFRDFVSSSLMPLSRTQEGGGLMLIDAGNYSENDMPANSSVPAGEGQKQFTLELINTERGLSDNGRITTPYPLWDGSNRFLLAFRPCEVTRNGAVIPCARLTAEERARVSDDQRPAAQAASDPVQDNAPAAYGIYMYDPAAGSNANRIVALPPQGFMFTDPIPIVARAEPQVVTPTAVDATLAAQGKAVIEVRSVYDTDGLNRMGDLELTAADLPSGCTTSIAKTTPSNAEDTRPQIADLARIKDPADPAYRCAPARFVRVVRAVAPPSSAMGMRTAIGETEFEQQRILGYVPVEPDGSFKVEVPADTPLAFSVIDAKGRSFQTHTNWIQVRPGERRTCDGCHSPRRGASINSGAVVNTMPAALEQTKATQHQSGETMASLRFRLAKQADPAADLGPVADQNYVDDWADTTQTGVAARATIAVKYTGNANPADDLVTPAPVNGLINYPDHIAPIWTRSRGPGGADTCTNCHSDSTILDLRSTQGGTGRLTSYEELVIGDPKLDANGQPVIAFEDGVPVVQRDAALVETSSGASNTAGQTRKSRLGEILFGDTLLAGAEALAKHPNPPNTAPDHATLLNAAEKRLVAEWMDLGGQYYNNPFDSSAVQFVDDVSDPQFKATFDAQVFPILRSTCAAACHQAQGAGDPTVPPGTLFRSNRFVLTGDPDGDFGVTLSMISDACNASSNYLLQRPSTIPHPLGATGQTTAVLPVGSANYNTIAAWIATACH